MKYQRQLILGLLVLVLGFSLSGCRLFRRGDNQETEQERQKISQPVNQIPVAERPYLSLFPSNDGRNLILSVYSRDESASQAEFELEYSAGSLIQGAFGSMPIENGVGTYEILLGSCSTGGTCSYHEDVTGGDLIVSLESGEDYAVQIPWRYQETDQADGQFGTRDQRFQISGEGLFSQSRVVILAETSGPPAETEGEIIAGPYGVFPAVTPTADSVDIRIRVPDAQAPQLWGWDEQSWQEVEAEYVDNTLVATQANYYSTYVVTE